MSDHYKKSYEIFERAKMIIPGGVTKARVDHVPGRYPIYMDSAQGAHVWDVDGHEYIDWMSGYGCILLGHRYKAVDDAAKRQMEKGFISFLSSPLQNDLAELLIETIPSAQMVRFCKSGSDATVGAVRIARIHTGRDKVIRWGYHGWSDWALSNFYGFDAGVPQSTRDMTLTFQYNDLDSLKATFEANPQQIACLIMMPFETDMPNKGFLEGAKKICHDNGAVFIFDEVRSSYRMALGGAQEYYDVIPDLTTVSKTMANGYAIGAVVGKKEVMKSIEKGLFSATFFVSSLEMAASMATINILQNEPVIEHIWRLGKKLQTGLSEIAADTPIAVEIVGTPPMPFMKFCIEDEDTNNKAKMEFYAEVAARGVYFHPGHHWFVNYSHTDEDVEKTLEICRKAFKVAEQAIG